MGYLCLVSIELRVSVKTGNAYFSNTVARSVFQASSVFQVGCMINLKFLVHHVALIYQWLKVPFLKWLPATLNRPGFTGVSNP